MNTDQKYMRRCLELAEKGLGMVAPNPLVGSVIVKGDIILGEGYHRKYGEAHAEVNAVNDAKSKYPEIDFSECTLYVNLEPCTHQGKTPACTDLIRLSKFKRVVIGCEDPFEKVKGTGIKILRESGIQVQSEILINDALYINRRFICFHQQKRPYIILKYAQSQDHFISALNPTKENRWITNEFSRKLVHKWRSEEQAIMVGTNTALIDNPALTLRDWPGKQGLRIVIDRKLKLSNSLNLFDQSANTLVLNEEKDDIDANIEYIKLDFSRSIIDQICKILYDKEIQSVIIEGGLNLLQSFIDKKLWDEARVFTSSKILNNGISSPVLLAQLYKRQNLAGDILKIYHPLN